VITAVIACPIERCTESFPCVSCPCMVAKACKNRVPRAPGQTNATGIARRHRFGEKDPLTSKISRYLLCLESSSRERRFVVELITPASSIPTLSARLTDP
jgi:hypothetical protein